MSRDLADLRMTLAGRAHVLLDFDGPICAVYAGTPAPLVARQLRDQIRATFGVALPDETDDPLDVIRNADVREAGGSEAAERMLTALEVEAVRTAQPTPGAAELITVAQATGRTVTIVSNNSAQAIARYWHDHGLAAQIDHVIGRDQDPALMKPDPYLVEAALTALSTTGNECVFVGDSVADVAAGHLAGVQVIGYASRPSKADQLASAGADAVTDSLAHIREALYDARQD